jgi:hypothetical protein
LRRAAFMTQRTRGLGEVEGSFFRRGTKPNKVDRLFGCPRDSNPDMLIQSQISHVENKENTDLRPAKCVQTRQNTRKRVGDALLTLELR